MKQSPITNLLLYHLLLGTAWCSWSTKRPKPRGKSRWCSNLWRCHIA